MTLIAALPNIQAVMSAKVLGKIVFDVIDRVPQVKDSPNPKLEISLKTSIQFRNVTFKYPMAPKEFKNILDNVSFEIRAGETTAIVGPSGSGKSTIVQMIERFYDPIAGNIMVDEVNIKDIQIKKLRESIGYVSQEPVLILGTIRDNLLFGNRDATEEDMKIALEKANASFVFELEKQLDTYIGSTSVLNLSGGQKQRIAIARALIKKPTILILDEATSALDPKSEKEVQVAIEKISNESNVKAKLTIIIIAHRLSTIEHADNMIFFKSNNEIVRYAKGSDEFQEILNKLKNETMSDSGSSGSSSPEFLANMV